MRLFQAITRIKRKSDNRKCSFVALCRKEATRTPDPYVPNVVRYQLRYFPPSFAQALLKRGKVMDIFSLREILLLLFYQHVNHDFRLHGVVGKQQYAAASLECVSCLSHYCNFYIFAFSRGYCAATNLYTHARIVYL